MTSQPLTYLMYVFNEEERIADILHHAVQWADEVLILDKQSTDGTCTICSEFGSKVRVVEIPFTPQGHDDIVSASRLAAHDWIWIGTCSEIPARKLVTEAKRIIAEQPGLDLVHVPRKIYSFGCDSPDSPWGVRNYPFLINRQRAHISNTIHFNFRPKDKNNIAQIAFAEDCCVHHYTHATAKGYISAMTQYFEAESERPDQAEVMQDALARLEKRRDLRALMGTDSFGLECAWRFYWLGVALHAWEKLRGVNAPDRYRTMRRAVLVREWPSSASSPDSSQAVKSRSPAEVAITPIIFSRGVHNDLQEPKEDDLLHALRGRPLSKLVKTLYQIGGHRFQEKSLFFEIFPHLQRVVLFEPLPELYAILKEQEKGDPRIVVLPYAISKQHGETASKFAGNDGATSSKSLSGEQVKQADEINVQIRTLSAAIEEHQLPPPDFLFLDVQGAEHQILATISDDLQQCLRMIYTKVNTVVDHADSIPLKDLEQILASNFSFAGYCPLKEQVPNLGNALFVNKSQTWLLLPPEPPVSTHDFRESGSRSGAWAKFFRTKLSRKLRRSIRKRLIAFEQAFKD